MPISKKINLNRLQIKTKYFGKITHRKYCLYIVIICLIQAIPVRPYSYAINILTSSSPVDWYSQNKESSDEVNFLTDPWDLNQNPEILQQSK